MRVYMQIITKSHNNIFISYYNDRDMHIQSHYCYIYISLSYNIILWCTSRLCSCTRALYHGCNYTIVYAMYLSFITGDCPHGSIPFGSRVDREIHRFYDEMMCHFYVITVIFTFNFSVFCYLMGVWEGHAVNRRLKFDYATRLSKLEVKLPKLVVQLTESCSKAQALGSRNKIIFLKYNDLSFRVQRCK